MSEKPSETVVAEMTITLYDDQRVNLSYPLNIPMSLMMLGRALDILSQEMLKQALEPKKPLIEVPKIVLPTEFKKKMN